MMLAGTELQVLVARRPVDFRNYAERTIMWGPRQEVAARRGFLVGLTPHNSAYVRPYSAWP
jgi:hypothetical protein